MTTSTSGIGWTIRLEIHDGQAEAFEQIAERVAEDVEKAEPGTVFYRWFISEDKKTARVLEWFADDDAALTHLTSPTSQKHMGELMGMVDHEIEVYGTPGEKLARTIAGFNVTDTYAELCGFAR